MLVNLLNTKNNRSGFTLIEVLVVVAVFGVVAGVLFSVINVNSSRDTALDSVRASTTEKLAAGLESYYSAEGVYPANTNDPELLVYIKEWPTGRPEGEYSYFVSPDRQTMGVLIEKANTGGTQQAFKYRSDWKSTRECTSLDPSSSDCGGGSAIPPTCENSACNASCGAPGGSCVSGSCHCNIVIPPMCDPTACSENCRNDGYSGGICDGSVCRCQSFSLPSCEESTCNSSCRPFAGRCNGSVCECEGAGRR